MAQVRIASVNVNGIRAAMRKGMQAWIDDTRPDILALQEVRANEDILRSLVSSDWHILSDEATAKGRAGVAILSRLPATTSRTAIGLDEFDSAGRWLEADFTIGREELTVVSAYVHSGEADTPKQIEKWKMLDAMVERLPRLAAEHPLGVVVGDLNVGHTKLDIKNWRGNVKHAGFLPRERAYFDRFFGPQGESFEAQDGTEVTGLGWVDIGRQKNGEVDGPYTWWSWRGQAFTNDTGWRIDYAMATPALAEQAVMYRVDRATDYDGRWSDHAPVVVDYEIG